MINPFNKWVVLGLRNLDPFNKPIGLVYVGPYNRILMGWYNRNTTHEHELPSLIETNNRKWEVEEKTRNMTPTLK